ncbi:predicted protein [Nematostella vectensis]|uniref:Presenilin n=1 Tax=Nematostella vectensis TaxID=45351 RepID=A7RXC7_NEMVE|nr:predicted protein [Nematostella vectensis]|eukprot:XP_001636006.1 predicted protein [Nematostella vectensis]
MSLHNFWIMDASVCSLVFMSAFYGEKTRKSFTSDSAPTKNGKKTTEPVEESQKLEPASLPWYILLNFAYFATMGLTVICLQYYPSVMIILQHLAVLCFILVAFTQWFPGKIAYFVGMSFACLWLVSVKTQFRWLINNVIIAMFSLLASHVQFRNFAFLQIFLWTAFLYDVCLLSRMNDGSPAIFSVGDCSSLLCQLFEMNNAWELPAVFTVRFGENTTHVFLGTGDIVIGAIIANFAMSFFKSFKCVIGIVSSYGLAIAFLSQVDSNKPYPALVSIVPCCTVAIILCAVINRKTKRLFSMSIRECESKDDESLLVI